MAGVGGGGRRGQRWGAPALAVGGGRRARGGGRREASPWRRGCAGRGDEGPSLATWSSSHGCWPRRSREWRGEATPVGDPVVRAEERQGGQGGHLSVGGWRRSAATSATLGGGICRASGGGICRASGGGVCRASGRVKPGAREDGGKWGRKEAGVRVWGVCGPATVVCGYRLSLGEL
jgi:hypothetical protein